MELKIIKTKKQYQEYLDWVDKMFDKKVKANSPEGEKLKVALLLIKQYEDVHYPIPVPDQWRHQIEDGTIRTLSSCLLFGAQRCKNECSS